MEKHSCDAAHINTSDTAVSSEPGNVNTDEFDSANISKCHISGMERILGKAVKAYNDSLEEYWRQYMELPSETIRVAGQDGVSNGSSKTEQISMINI